MDNAPSSGLSFKGVLESDLGVVADVGDVVTVEYLGTRYSARVTSRYEDYDDFGTAATRYNLDAIGVATG